MRVNWHPPGQPPHETDFADVEQLLFLLRMIQTVELKGELYSVRQTGLVLEGSELSVSVWLHDNEASGA